MSEQRKFVKWIKDHRKALIIAGVSVATLIVVVLGIKNKEAIKEVWASLRKVVEKPAAHMLKETSVAPVIETVCPAVEKVTAVAAHHADTLPFEVSRHIRNLPGGMHASPEKIAAALEQHFVLQEGQTWVEAYMKGAIAA